nr:keratin, type I cytoskeletal 9-like [Ipomoea batatas]
MAKFKALALVALLVLSSVFVVSQSRDIKAEKAAQSYREIIYGCAKGLDLPKMVGAMEVDFRCIHKGDILCLRIGIPLISANSWCSRGGFRVPCGSVHTQKRNRNEDIRGASETDIRFSGDQQKVQSQARAA